jgi:uncharacterized protein (TIRG00374 family)
LETYKRIKLRYLVFAILIALAIYILLFLTSDLDRILIVISNFSYLLWIQVVALSVLSYVSRFIRWKSFLDSSKVNIPLVYNILIYYSAFSLTLTPGKAGETVRSVFLKSYNVNYSQSISMFISERFLDLLAVTLLASLFIFLNFTYLFYVLIIFTIIISFYAFINLSWLTGMLKRFKFWNIGAYIINMVDCTSSLLTMQRLPFLIVSSMIAWASQGFSLYIILREMGFNLSVWQCIPLYSLSILIGAASLVPGGLGVTEVAITTLLMSTGLGREDAFLAAIISRGTTLWLAVFVGIIAMSFMSANDRSIIFETKS